MTFPASAWRRVSSAAVRAAGAVMKIAAGRKETTGANSDCCHGPHFVRDPGLSEEVKVVASKA